MCLSSHNLDVVTLELGMKVCDLCKYYFYLTNYGQFVEFGQIGHTKIRQTVHMDFFGP